MLELFLLDAGIVPSFYESEYAQYWQDAMFDNGALQSFKPEIIFIHTSLRNIVKFPTVKDDAAAVDALRDEEYGKFAAMWDKVAAVYHCPIIQNNFEMPFYRLLGNKDASDIHGRLNFAMSLNEKFYEYARAHESFYINDINYLSACYGLDKWSNPAYWHLYKYALCMEAIPEFAMNVAHIIKSIYGKNKKALSLDLDNTLWGGVVGDDGAENIEIGQETAAGQVYSEFQSYIKAHKDFGVLLTVNSKNDEENALAGLNRPDCVLHSDDFIVIKANWESKDRNLIETAKALNIGEDAFVFVDDNPAERAIVAAQVPSAAIPALTSPEDYIRVLDKNAYFEVTQFSADDIKRFDMYKANAKRAAAEASFTNYKDYLFSLDMKAEILPFAPMYMSRIAQLTNKSNQFNLTTKRCTQDEIEEMARDNRFITLYGKLTDKFGDNGVVSVVSGHISEAKASPIHSHTAALGGHNGKTGAVFHIDLWLMSCRVLKRDMEYAMMDTLVHRCRERDIKHICGYYYPTAKNKMVKDFFALHGFQKTSEDSAGNAVWERDIEGYEDKNKVIAVNSDGKQ